MSWRNPIWTRFLPTSFVLTLARIGPLGRMSKAPGTWGSLGGLMYQLVFFHHVGWVGTVLCTLPLLLLAVAICAEAEFRLGRQDPGEVVLDEFVVMPLCFLGWPALAAQLPPSYSPWAVFLLGFALFRLFDITKPLGISRLQDLPGGWGVVADDVGAALATCATLHGLGWAAGHWGLL